MGLRNKIHTVSVYPRLDGSAILGVVDAVISAKPDTALERYASIYKRCQPLAAGGSIGFLHKATNIADYWPKSS